MMRAKKRLWIAGLCAAAAWWGMAVSCGGQAGEPKVGAVDLVRVFDEYKKSEDLEKRLTEEAEAFAEKKKSLEEALEKLNGEMELLSPDSALREEKESVLYAKTAEYKTFVKLEQGRLKNKQGKLIWEIYNEIRAVVAEYAEREGYGLVLKADSTEWGGGGPEEVQLRIAVRSLLYCSSSCDLTDDIIAGLNEKYEAEKEEAAEAEEEARTGPPEKGEETQETPSANDTEGNS